MVRNLLIRRKKRFMNDNDLENIDTLRALLGDSRVLDELLRYLPEEDVDEFIRNLMVDFDIERLYSDEDDF